MAKSIIGRSVGSSKLRLLAPGAATTRENIGCSLSSLAARVGPVSAYYDRIAIYRHRLAKGIVAGAIGSGQLFLLAPGAATAGEHVGRSPQGAAVRVRTGSADDGCVPIDGHRSSSKFASDPDAPAEPGHLYEESALRRQASPWRSCHQMVRPEARGRDRQVVGSSDSQAGGDQGEQNVSTKSLRIMRFSSAAGTMPRVVSAAMLSLAPRQRLQPKNGTWGPRTALGLLQAGFYPAPQPCRHFMGARDCETNKRTDHCPIDGSCTDVWATALLRPRERCYMEAVRDFRMLLDRRCRRRDARNNPRGRATMGSGDPFQ